MIVDDLNVMSVAVREPKANSPWSIDRDRPLTFPVALKRMQPDALERADMIEPTGCVENRQ
jgi:hypothetical protein